MLYNTFSHKHPPTYIVFQLYLSALAIPLQKTHTQKPKQNRKTTQEYISSLPQTNKQRKLRNISSLPQFFLSFQLLLKIKYITIYKITQNIKTYNKVGFGHSGAIQRTLLNFKFRAHIIFSIKYRQDITEYCKIKSRCRRLAVPMQYILSYFL